MSVRTVLGWLRTYPVDSIILMTLLAAMTMFMYRATFAPIGTFTDFQRVQLAAYTLLMVSIMYTILNAARTRVMLQEITDRERKGGL